MNNSKLIFKLSIQILTSFKPYVIVLISEKHRFQHEILPICRLIVHLIEDIFIAESFKNFFSSWEFIENKKTTC
jgi:hypothetical protein